MRRWAAGTSLCRLRLLSGHPQEASHAHCIYCNRSFAGARDSTRPAGCAELSGECGTELDWALCHPRENRKAASSEPHQLRRKTPQHGTSALGAPPASGEIQGPPDSIARGGGCIGEIDRPQGCPVRPGWRRHPVRWPFAPDEPRSRGGAMFRWHSRCRGRNGARPSRLRLAQVFRRALPGIRGDVRDEPMIKSARLELWSA